LRKRLPKEKICYKQRNMIIGSGVMKLLKVFILLLVVTAMFLSGCQTESNEISEFEIKEVKLLSTPPHGVYYEIFVRSFADSDGDGIGDFKGATAKLDYLEDLGIEGIWLMPINPSPSYHGYDVTDYRDIHPEFGTLEDFKMFVDEAHNRGIKVIMDLVVNHSSKEHPWFQKALTGDEEFRDWYVWADEETNTGVLGEWGQKVWHGSGQNVYEGVFWDGMPDLNLENPEVRNEMIDIGQFWLSEVGVDGFRLDAAKHVFSHYQVENDEEKDHEWWREFYGKMKDVKPDTFLVGEVWDSATVVAPYLQGGLTSAFNFDLSLKILSAASSESEAGIVSSLERIRKFYTKESGGTYIDSTFITNHDMNRVMSDLKGNVNHAKMAASLLLTLPGNPFIYYGEEIGMEGQKPDEWIREPFLWSDDYKTTWERNKHNNNTVPVEEQLEDPNSLVNYYKELIHVRRSHEALIKGEINKTTLKADGLVVFERVTETESLLVVLNMSGKEVDLTITEKYADYTSIYYSDKQASLKNEILKLPAYSTTILQK
jgi:alpha-amylase